MRFGIADPVGEGNFLYLSVDDTLLYAGDGAALYGPFCEACKYTTPLGISSASSLTKCYQTDDMALHSIDII